VTITELRRAMVGRRVWLRVPIALRSTIARLVELEDEHSPYAISQHVEISRTAALRLLKKCSSDYIALAFIDDRDRVIIGGRS
jgi:hypothetical protein